VDDLMTFWVALQHGPGNPIEVKDDEDFVEDGEIEARIAQGELVLLEDIPLREEGLPGYQE